MHTQRTILLLVAAGAAAVVGAVVTACLAFGAVAGLGISAATAVVIGAVYVFAVRPWHLRWGATTDEVRAALPGDELLPGARSTTRAIAIAAPPEDVWPWLVQLGYGRAGWYSYDWIDNDGIPSVDRIVHELQELKVGDRIEMMPGSGFVVRYIADGRAILGESDDGSTTWCLYLARSFEGSRLLSRFRARWKVTPASAIWIALAEPGGFVMERKMLIGLKKRAERAHEGPSTLVP